MMILPLTYVAAAAARFNLADFGAVGDNQTLCTHAFEAVNVEPSALPALPHVR